MWYNNIAGSFFGLIIKHTCDRRTDGRTNRQNYDSQDRASIAVSRGKQVTAFQIVQSSQEGWDTPISYVGPDNQSDSRLNSFLPLPTSHAGLGRQKYTEYFHSQLPAVSHMLLTIDHTHTHTHTTCRRCFSYHNAQNHSHEIDNYSTLFVASRYAETCRLPFVGQAVNEIQEILQTDRGFAVHQGQGWWTLAQKVPLGCQNIEWCKKKL